MDEKKYLITFMMLNEEAGQEMKKRGNGKIDMLDFRNGRF